MPPHGKGDQFVGLQQLLFFSGFTQSAPFEEEASIKYLSPSKPLPS